MTAFQSGINIVFWNAFLNRQNEGNPLPFAQEIPPTRLEAASEFSDIFSVLFFSEAEKKSKKNYWSIKNELPNKIN